MRRDSIMGTDDTRVRILKPERTLYDELEVSQRASPIVIRAAYRALAQSLHPDKNCGTQASGERLAGINAAYSILSDPARRLQYDRTRGLNATDTERRGVVSARGCVAGHCRAEGRVTRPFGFRPLD